MRHPSPKTASDSLCGWLRLPAEKAVRVYALLSAGHCNISGLTVSVSVNHDTNTSLRGETQKVKKSWYGLAAIPKIGLCIVRKRCLPTVMKDAEFALIQASRLSARHKEFVVHYLRERNAAEAARQCGYAKPHKHSGFVVLERADVKELVAHIIDRRLRNLHVTAERIEDELARVAFATLDDLIDIQADGTPMLNLAKASSDTIAAVRRLTYEVVNQSVDDNEVLRYVLRMRVEMLDKLGALDKLARIHRMINGRGGGVESDDNIAEAIRAARTRAGLSMPVPDDTV